MTLEQQFYTRIRELGYWDRLNLTNRKNHNHKMALAWCNPNTTADPEMMFQLVWLLSSTKRRQRLNAIDVRILEQTAEDLAENGLMMSARKSYVQYLWQQVHAQELTSVN
jgi:predicted component of type VI protein secretion system